MQLRPYVISNRLLELLLAVLSFAGCNTDLGVRGSTFQDAGGFSGIATATVLSPSTVKVTWNTASQYSSYQIFSSSSSAVLGTTIFSSYTASGLAPDTSYTFSVGGQRASSVTLDGLNTKLKVQTWPVFKGVVGALPTSPISLQISWNYPVTGPTFNVYLKAGGPPSSPADFAKPALSTSANTVGVTQLADGTPIAANTTYFVVVRATFLDGTREFNSASASVTTPSNINPMPVITTDAVLIGRWPTFNVTGGLAQYQTSFKNGSTFLGTVNGNASFKTPTTFPLNPGENQITATVTSNGSSVTLPPLKIRARMLNETMHDHPAFFAVEDPVTHKKKPKGNQRLGKTLVTGDFNCDGFQDLAAAAPWATYSPQTRGGQEGVVYVYYGSASGLDLSAAPSATPAAGKTLLLARPKLSSDGVNAYHFGELMAAGNLNGDVYGGKGCDDLAVGTSFYDAVWVFFGGPAGLQTGSPVLNSAACSGSNCAPLRITPTPGSINSSRSYFGSHALSIGKLHKPAAGESAPFFRDLVISACGEALPPTATHGRGAVFIYYGGAQGINFTNPPSPATPAAPFTKIDAPFEGAYNNADIFGVTTGNFGLGAAALDMDGDGIDDLTVGAYRNINATGMLETGAVYFYGTRTAGIAAGAGFPAGLTPVRFTNPVARPVAGQPWIMHFGGQLAKAGDINGDGFDDLLIGHGDRNDWNSSITESGFVVLYGSTTGPQTSNGCAVNGNLVGNSSPACQMNATQSCVPNAPGAAGTCKALIVAASKNAAMQVTTSVNVTGASAGVGQDVNNDGFHDIMVGWDWGSPGGMRGDVYYGSANGLQVSPSKLTPLVLDAGVDNIGAGIALGNFNGDLYADVALGSPDNMTLNGAAGGVVMTYAGGSSGLPPINTGYGQLIADNVGKEGEATPSMMQIGDVNGDGYTDALVTSYRVLIKRTVGYPAYGQNDAWIYYGSPTGLITSPTPSLSPLSPLDPQLLPAFVGGSSAPAHTALSAAGDVNGDGYSDIISVYGSAIVIFYYGSPTGVQTTNQPVLAPLGSGLDPVLIAQSDQTANTASYSFYSQNSEVNSTWFQGTMSSADLNGDGYSDIALGARASFGGLGSVLVIYGSATGPQSDGVLARNTRSAASPPADAGPNVARVNPCSGTGNTLTCRGQLLIGGGEANFGDSVAALGDVNGDGYGDLLVGSPNYAAQGANGGGAYLFFGSQSGLTLRSGSGSGLPVSPPILNVVAGGRYAGEWVAPAGDVNGDGFADFTISSIREVVTGIAGGSYLFYGCGNGGPNGTGIVTPGCPATGVWGVLPPPSVAAPGTVAINAPACDLSGCKIQFVSPRGVQPIAQGSGTLQFGAYWGRGTGYVGDVNKDGFADVIMTVLDLVSGCPGVDCEASLVQTGAAILFTGSKAGLVADQSVSRSPSCLNGACAPYWLTPSMTNYGAPGFPTYNTYTNNSIWNNPRAADFNGDGYPDIAIPAGAWANGDRTTTARGGFYVFE
jgi:hypothetical protein